MSKSVNPAAIGGFLVGAIVLLSVALLIFGGGALFKEKADFVVFFDSSLNGLNVGAPVKLQGVQIGAVKEITLQMDRTLARTLKPVVVEIDPERLVDSEGHPMQAARSQREREENAKRLIDAGLKAQLAMQSLLTGLLYVELNFYPNEPVRLTGLNYKDLSEMPSMPTTVDELRNTADEIIKEIRDLPLKEIVNDFSATLVEIRDIVKSDDVKRIRASLAKTTEEAAELAKKLNQKLGPFLADAQGMVKESRELMGEVRSETRGRIGPLLVAAEQAVNEATRVLEDTRGTIDTVEVLVGQDSILQQSLKELRDAARSLRDLADALERNPDSLLFGRP